MLNTGSSIVSNPQNSNGATSLAEVLFPGAEVDNRVEPSGGFEVRCEHCARTAFSIVENVLVVTHRHGTQWHKTVIGLQELGLKRADG